MMRGVFFNKFAWLVAVAALAVAGCQQNGTGGSGTDSQDLANQLHNAVEILDRSMPDGAVELEHRQVREGKQNPDSPLLIIPITVSQKRRFEKANGRKWTPLDGVKDMEENGPPPASYEVREMTEFWAVYIDYEKTMDGKIVVFNWLHGLDNRPYAEPVSATMRRHGDFPYPVAWAYCWSDPASAGRLVRGLGLRTVTRTGDWANSRCYGPRAVRVQDLKRLVKEKDGKVNAVPGENIMAEAGIDLVEPGVQVVE